ncbi:MAG: serine/threonine-protein kinase [Methanoregula sp.]
MPATLKAGDMVSGYNIIGLLGQGGFSQIYKAHSPDGTQVILKFPDVSMLGDQATYERFRREVAIGQKLDHPAIPHTISFIEGPDSVFLVMEYIEGPSLREYITEKAPLPIKEGLLLADQLAEAIDYLHSHGVCHRDLKPENIIVGPDNSIHILDFGSALLEGSRRVTWRWASNAFGTPDYMAPEQIQGKRGDVRTDVYALGMIVYEMLAGALPFEGDNVLAVMNQHLTGVPVSLCSFQPSIPAGIEAVIMKSIRRDPDERYRSASAFKKDLDNYADLDLSQFQSNPEAAVSGGVLTNHQIWVRTILVFVGFLALVVLIVLAAYLMHHH